MPEPEYTDAEIAIAKELHAAACPGFAWPYEGSNKVDSTFHREARFINTHFTRNLTPEQRRAAVEDATQGVHGFFRTDLLQKMEAALVSAGLLPALPKGPTAGELIMGVNSDDAVIKTGEIAARIDDVLRPLVAFARGMLADAEYQSTAERALAKLDALKQRADGRGQ